MESQEEEIQELTTMMILKLMNRKEKLLGIMICLICLGAGCWSANIACRDIDNHYEEIYISFLVAFASAMVVGLILLVVTGWVWLKYLDRVVDGR